MKLWPDTNWYTIAVRPIPRPSSDVTSTRLRWTTGRSDRPTHRITQPRQAAAMPRGTAQASVATVGVTSGGTVVSAREKSPRPVQLSSPTNTIAPTPAASRPGRTTRLSLAPAIPAASMIRNAPSRGEPSSVLIAAKLPADAMMVTAIGGASFLSRCTTSAARPPPIAISGASGPSTAPSASVVNEARTIAGSSRSTGGPPPVTNPKAGE